MLKTDTKNAFLPFTTSGVPAVGLTLTWPEHGMNMEHGHHVKELAISYPSLFGDILALLFP